MRTMKRVIYSIAFICIFISTISAWTTPINISVSEYADPWPDLEIDSSGYLYVVWGESLPCNSYYSNSTNGGATWNTPVSIPYDYSGVCPSPLYYQDLEIDSNMILHIVFVSQMGSPGDQDVIYSNSSDRGTTWNTPVNISNNSGQSLRADLEIDSSGNLYVIWEDNTYDSQYDIFYSNSSDVGITWTTAVNISNSAGNSEISDLEIDSSVNLYVIWADNRSGQFDIYYSNSTDRGATWSTAVNISATSGNSTFPDLEIDSNVNLYVVWHDNTSGQNDILYSNSSDRGSTWSTAVNISANSAISKHADLEIDSNANLQITWDDNTSGNYSIYYSNSSNKGATWQTATAVYSNINNSYTPDLELDSSANPLVIWKDEIATDIYFSKNVVAITSTVIVVTTEELTIMAVVILFILALLIYLQMHRGRS